MLANRKQLLSSNEWDSSYGSDSSSSSDSSQLNSRHNSGNSSSWEQFNILYIAVPVAGACVVLALVIFSLYLLKLNRQQAKKKEQPGGFGKSPSSCSSGSALYHQQQQQHISGNLNQQRVFQPIQQRVCIC